MFLQPGYEVFKEIYEGENSRVYRGIRIADQKLVILKYLKKEFPTDEELARFNYEYEMLKSLKQDGTVQAYALEAHEHSLVIVMEDFGDYSLRNFISARRYPLIELLEISIAIVECLERIHHHHIIHKDINPANILYDHYQKQVKIIDFGISIALEKEITHNYQINMLEGMISYLSPEQTGRMNRDIDYRTDYYSLGVTLYLMFAGKLPFESKDLIELVHAHIAKMPEPIHEIDDKIPEVISNIILRLMAKTAEARYQSTIGIKEDLKNCLMQLNTTGKIISFPIGEKDISYRFQIPEKLYGRKNEVIKLLNAFKRISKGPSALLLVNGYSGIGKSSLVHEIYKPLVEKHGYFVSGKFDQIKNNVPYSSIIQAIDGLIHQFMSEPYEKVKSWQNRIQQAVEPNGQVLIELIPALSALIGEQPPVPRLDANEAQHRFNTVFQNFIREIATADHPLVIFLDDLQWADLTSLKLIENLLNKSNIEYLLIIGAYRNNEVDSAHPLQLMIETLQHENVPLTNLTLKPLGLNHIEQLLADTMHQDISKMQQLANICELKTQGNPFFLNQFLYALWQEKLIYYDAVLHNWTWNIDKINKRESTENVVQLMAEKIKKLSHPAQAILRYAACLGNRFDLQTLASINGQSLKKTADILWETLQEGLILPLDESYKLITEDNQLNAQYQFLHDRVQQAAYHLLPDAEKKPLHLAIGRLLLAKTTEEKREEHLFDIINQLNMGLDIITEPREKLELAHLNLIAGLKAKKSVAYAASYQYFQNGLHLLTEKMWQTNYKLALTLFTEATESAYLCKEYQEMEKLGDLTLAHAHNILDQVKIYELRINCLIAQNKLPEAVGLSLTVLKKLGLTFPKKTTKLHILIGLLKAKFLLWGKTDQDLLNLPIMTDPYKLAASQIISNTQEAAYYAEPFLCFSNVLTSFRLSLKYGYCKETSIAYSGYAVFLAGIGDINGGYHYSQLSLQLLKIRPIAKIQATVLMAFGVFTQHWKEPLKNTFQTMRETYLQGMESGNVEMAMVITYVYPWFAFHAGLSLTKVQALSEQFHPVIIRSKNKMALPILMMLEQVIHNLTHEMSLPENLIGQYFDEIQLLPVFESANNQTGLFYYYAIKVQLCYLFGRYLEALNYIQYAYQYIESATSLPHLRTLNFYESLILIALLPQVTKNQQQKYLKKIKTNQKQLKKWSDFCPENCLHKYYLIKAELLAFLNQNENAAFYYDQAIELANKSEYLQEQALANELAAIFYLKQNKERIARVYILPAHYIYTRWGAKNKMMQLEKNYPQFFAKTMDEAKLNISTSISRSKSMSDSLDLSTVVKATQAIASEIVLENVLKKLMHIVIENAGGQKGYLLLEKKGSWYIEAAINDSKVTVLQSAPLKALPQSIINYVINIKKEVLLDDATENSIYSKDPYIIAKKPKSVLCLPLLKQRQLSGILYLENNLSKGSFTQDRFKLLKLLSAQIIISIENARLYQNLAALNLAYEHFVPKEFLSLLHKDSITDVHLGDQIKQEMTVMFCDIRNFTDRSEKLTPQASFKYINDFLSFMEPAIAKHHGFIDKYIGDAIMAIFPGCPDDALKSSITMLASLKDLNDTHPEYAETLIGIGLNTGQLMLGVVGGSNRMEGSVISDAVNIASRTEALTKLYGVALIITEEVYSQLLNPSLYAIRKLDTVLLKGKSKPVSIYEVFDTDPEDVKQLKKASIEQFETAVNLFHQEKYQAAKEIFVNILALNKKDHTARTFLMRCESSLVKPSADLFADAKEKHKI